MRTVSEGRAGAAREQSLRARYHTSNETRCHTGREEEQTAHSDNATLRLALLTARRVLKSTPIDSGN